MSKGLFVPPISSDSTYKTICKVNGVSVKVPTGNCEYMKIVPEHKFFTRGGTEVKEEKHYKHGQPVRGVIINRHFKSITPEDFGRRIIATVEVVIKMIGGKKYMMLNIIKDPDAKPTLKMMVVDTKTPGAGDISIHGSDQFLHFEPMPEPEKQSMAAV